MQTRGGGGPIVSQRNERDGGPVIEVALNNLGNLTALVREDGGEWGQAASVQGGKVNDGRWHHFALIRSNGNRIELFLDGISQGQGVGANAGGPITTNLRALGSDRFWVLTHRAFGPMYLNGVVDEFCIFQRALDMAEIQALAGK
jgi:hypothetical protein